MESDLHPEEQTPGKFENLHKVTPLSRYLAMTLFIALPFIGGYVGYALAPEKVIEVERSAVEKSSESENQTEARNTNEYNDTTDNLIEFMNLPQRQGVLAYLEFEFDESLANETVEFDLVNHDNVVICNIGSDKLNEYSGDIVWLPNFTELSECPDGMIFTQYKIRTSLNDEILGYTDPFIIDPSYPLDATAVRSGFLRFEDPERGYSFTYPKSWELQANARTDYRRQGYIQLYNYDTSQITSDRRYWADNENKIEWGKVKLLDDVDSYETKIIAGKQVYTQKGGIDEGWNWTSFALQYPNQPEKVISFTIYGDTSNIQSALEVFLQDFELTQPVITD